MSWRRVRRGGRKTGDLIAVAAFVADVIGAARALAAAVGQPIPLVAPAHRPLSPTHESNAFEMSVPHSPPRPTRHWRAAKARQEPVHLQVREQRSCHSTPKALPVQPCAAAVAVRDVSTQVRAERGEAAAHGTHLQEPSSWQSPRKRQGM